MDIEDLFFTQTIPNFFLFISAIAAFIVLLEEIIGILLPVAIISFTLTKAVAKLPEGCVVTNFLFVNFFLFINAIPNASPKQQNIVVLAVGANEEPASITLGNKILIVECLSNIEEDLQETPITFKLNLLAYRSIEFSSEDSPDTLKIKRVSSFERKPKPQC